MLRELRAILNKLTPDNFGSLMKRLSRLEIDTEATLKAVISLVFDKAVMEQRYCPAYAKMCHQLLGVSSSGKSFAWEFMNVVLWRSLNIQVGTRDVYVFPQLNVATEDGHCVTFQKVLLRHCQSQFEKNHNEGEMINLQEELDATENVSVTITDATGLMNGF